MRLSIIVNPHAGSGRAARQLSRLCRVLEDAKVGHDVLATSRRGEGTELAWRAREANASAIVVLGGDGTLNEVSQAYVDGSGRPVPGPPVALVSAGTGGDFARMLAGAGRRALRRTLDELVHERAKAVDLGLVTLHDAEGGDVRRAFVNIASVGISGEIDERVERGPKWLGGKTAFFVATVAATLRYRNTPVSVKLDGQPWYRGPTFVTALANGRYFGGGMKIAPHAVIDDGRLDVVCLTDLERTEALSLAAKIYRGAHLGTPGIQTAQAQTIDISVDDARARVLVDVDGETPGYLPLSARVLPGAWRVVGA